MLRAGRLASAARLALAPGLRSPKPRVTDANPASRRGLAVVMGAGGAVGPVQKHIEATVAASALKPLHLEVENESHGRHEDESHFHVFVVSESFEGLNPIQRHRAVQGLLMDKSGKLPFHSLRLTTKTPSQWEANPAAPAPPKCTGRGDGRGPSELSGQLNN